MVVGVFGEVTGVVFIASNTFRADEAGVTDVLPNLGAAIEAGAEFTDVSGSFRENADVPGWVLPEIWADDVLFLRLAN